MSNLPLFDPPPVVTATLDVDAAARAFARSVTRLPKIGGRQDDRLVHLYVNR